MEIGENHLVCYGSAENGKLVVVLQSSQFYHYKYKGSVRLSRIKGFHLRKDYINISDDWKPKWIKIIDKSTKRVLHEQKINVVLKVRKKYNMDVVIKENGKSIKLNPSIISFMYSLDGKGIGKENPTTDKQWAHDGFLFYGNLDLRKKVMVPLFHLSASQFKESIFNDNVFARDKTRVSKVHIHAGYIVDSIQFEYDGQYNTPVHGGSGGEDYIMEIGKDDYITEISGTVGSYDYSGDCDTIGRLTIKTKKGKETSYGMSKCFQKRKDFVLKAHNGHQIFALAGKYIRTETLDNSYLSRIEIGLER